MVFAPLVAGRSIVKILWGNFAPCIITWCFKLETFFVLPETSAFSWQHGVTLPSAKLSTCFLVTYKSVIIYHHKLMSFISWIYIKLTTGCISGVILQPLAVIPSMGMSSITASDSNSTTWCRPSRALSFSCAFFTTWMETEPGAQL